MIRKHATTALLVTIVMAGCSTSNHRVECNAPSPAVGAPPAVQGIGDNPVGATKPAPPEIVSQTGSTVTYTDGLAPVTEMMSSESVASAKRSGIYEDLRLNLVPKRFQVWSGIVVTKSNDRCLATVSSIDKAVNGSGKPIMNTAQHLVDCPSA